MADGDASSAIVELEGIDKVYRDGVDNQVLFDIGLTLFEDDRRWN